MATKTCQFCGRDYIEPCLSQVKADACPNVKITADKKAGKEKKSKGKRKT